MAQPTLLSLSNDWLKTFNYVFTYLPTTNWQRFFNPTINIGCSNLDDAPVEQHVVDTVGSYGYQLNRVIDVLGVLVSELKPEKLTPQEQQYVFEFKKLAAEADRAAREFKDKGQNHDVSRASVDQFIEDLQSIQRSKPDLYQDLVQKVQTALEQRRAAGAGK